MNKIIDLEEDIEVFNLLAEHHSIFQTFFTIGERKFTRKIKTAAVGFDKIGKCICLIFNPDFWNSLPSEAKAFVIAHECLHVMLNHGQRGQEFKNKDLLNQAQDIVINEMLVDGFGFNRYSIPDWDKYCFIDTLFSPEIIIEKNIKKHKTFSYYYNKLVQNEINSDAKTIDMHIGTAGKSEEDSDGSSSQITDAIDELTSEELNDLLDGLAEAGMEATSIMDEEITDSLSDAEQKEVGEILGEELSDASKAGKTALGRLITVTIKPIKKQKGWEEIVRRHIRSVWNNEFVEKESWVSKGRRSQLLGDDLMLPGLWEEQKRTKSKYNLVFFLDASGSCRSHAERFVNLLKSIPEDKFQITAFSFDTNIYPIDLVNDTGVKGCGGTSFRILNNKINDISKENKRHPDAVFILSDGEGNHFSPERPELWHWILTPRYTKRYIPKESHLHLMEKFEN